MHGENERYGLNEPYWAKLSESEREMYRAVRPLRHATYRVDHPMARIETMISDFANDAKQMGGQLELNPDFQRGHVWSQDKQIAYVENLFRGIAPKNLRFNCAGWQGHKTSGDINPGDIVCVDGLQRLTAVREFMAGNFQVFGRYSKNDLKGTSFDPMRSTSWTISLEMFDISNRAELLQFYLDINRGGVVHTDEELNRVQALMEQAPQTGEPQGPGTPKTRKKRV